MTSEDFNLPQSLTDADFQAFSLDIAQARAEARSSDAGRKNAASDAEATAEGTDVDLNEVSSADREHLAASDWHYPDLTLAGGGSHRDDSPAMRRASTQDFEAVYCNLSVAELMEHALLRAEGVLSDRGALCVKTLPYSGTTAGSYFVVRPGLSPGLALEQTKAQRAQPFCPSLQPAPMDETTFWALYQRAIDYGQDKDLYRCDGGVCGSTEHGWNSIQQNSIQLICELASQAIMACHWLRPAVQPDSQPGPQSTAEQATQLTEPGEAPAELETPAGLTVIALNGLKGEPCLEPLLETEVFVVVHPVQRLALVGGSRHGGDLWNAIALLLSEVHGSGNTAESGLLLPEAVHCLKAPSHRQTANQQAVNQQVQQTALFLGAPGSGKQTLTAGLGDRWGKVWQRGPMQLQLSGGAYLQPLLGGSYGNISGLSADNILYEQLSFGAILENVPLRESSSQPRFSDLASAFPFRGAWQESSLLNPAPRPLNQIRPRQIKPSVIFLLVADPAGVLPAIAQLTAAQAVYYLTLGYGADLPGWNRHQLHPTPHFSSTDRHRAVQIGRHWQSYLQAENAPDIYLLNTGWLGPMSGAARSPQQRIPVSVSQMLIQAALAGELPLESSKADSNSHPVQIDLDPVFGWALPLNLEQLPRRWCQPWNAWDSPRSWRSAAMALANQFQAQMESLVAAGLPAAIAEAGPCLGQSPNSQVVHSDLPHSS